MSDWHLVFLVILSVGSAVVASTSQQQEPESLLPQESMETPDWNKGVQGDKQAEANSGVVFQTMKIPQRTDVSRGQLIHDILKKDEQRLKYFASRVESAKSESSKTEPPKLNPLKVVRDESGESTVELEESSTSGN